MNNTPGERPPEQHNEDNIIDFDEYWDEQYIELRTPEEIEQELLASIERHPSNYSRDNEKPD